MAEWFPQARLDTGAGVRLFCFPYAGGGASLYRQWLPVSPPGVQVCPAQLPGRESRISEPAVQDAVQLASMAAEAMIPHLGKPFAVFGHSMGALVGFEVVRALCRMGKELPLCLFVAGSRAPHLRRTEEPIHSLPDACFWERVRELDGLPTALESEPELKRLVLPTLRADFALCENYAYSDGPPLPVPIRAYGGIADSTVKRPEILAWRDHTTSTFRDSQFPGNHFFLQSEPHLLLTTMARELSALVGNV